MRTDTGGLRTFSGCWLVHPRSHMQTLLLPCTFSLLSDLSALVDLVQLDLVSDSFTKKLSVKAHP